MQVINHNAVCTSIACTSHADLNSDCSYRPISIFWLRVLCCCPPLWILFQFMQATEVGQTSLYCQKKITNKINRNPLLHSCPWDSKSVAYIRVLNIISKFWNHLLLGFNNAHKRRYGIPIRLVNICKVSSLGNQIPQSTKWATGTLSSHAFAYLSLYDARCTQIHLFSLCWDCSNNSKAELGAAVQAVLWRLFCFAEALTLLTLNSVGAGFQRTEE